MEKYEIEINETLCRTITVEAHSAGEAISIAKRQYHNGDIVLSEEDYVITEFELTEEELNRQFHKRKELGQR